MGRTVAGGPGAPPHPAGGGAGAELHHPVRRGEAAGAHRPGLVQDTPCLILDEPTNHLDIKYQLQLMELVRVLGRTVVAAIHDLNLAALYCQRSM